MILARTYYSRKLLFADAVQIITKRSVKQHNLLMETSGMALCLSNFRIASGCPFWCAVHVIKMCDSKPVITLQRIEKKKYLYSKFYAIVRMGSIKIW